MSLGKLLIGAGVVLVLAGVLVMLLDRAHVLVGRLPGDIVYRGKNAIVYFPLMTSIVMSVVLSLVFYVLSRFRR